MKLQPQLTWLAISINLVCPLIQAANILVVIPLAFYSHSSSVQPLLRALAARGHNVTVVSPYRQKTLIPNLTDIVVPNYVQEFLETLPKDNLLELGSLRFHLTGIWNLGMNGITKAMQNEQIQKLMQDTQSQFHLIITETWFAHEPFVAFGHKFHAPVINIMPTFLFPQAAFLTGNHFSISYVPVVKPGFTDCMNFNERILNFIFYYWDVFVGQLYYIRHQETIMKEYFKYPGSETLPPLLDMLRNTSITLLDAHPAIGYPTPLHKNIVFFGGANVTKPEKLPNDLQNLMNSAKEGVIYFSFGSFTTISNLKPKLQHAILSALSKVKQKVLIRLDDPNLLKVHNISSGNIETRKWFPQVSVLAHPNCKLFITHGGIHGIMEGIAQAVPLIGIPLLGDQNYNTLFIESAGIGYRLPLSDITEENLLYAINSVLNDPKYRKKMNERSAIFKDNPIDILDNAIYWIEYVIRHKGAPHLRPAVLDLHWYQYLMLDVIAFYLLLIIIVVYIFILLMKLLYICICSLCNNFILTHFNKKCKTQ